MRGNKEVTQVSPELKNFEEVLFVKTKKWIACVLAVLISIQLFPAGAFAQAPYLPVAEEDVDELMRTVSLIGDYHSLSAGRAGTVRVNDFTLLPELTYPVLGIDGNLYPVQINMKYGTTIVRLTSFAADYSITTYGDGFLTTMHERIISYGDSANPSMLCVAGSGSASNFHRDLSASALSVVPEATEVWKTDDGFETLYHIPDNVTPTTPFLLDGAQACYWLTDGSDTIKCYDTDGRYIGLVKDDLSRVFCTLSYVPNAWDLAIDRIVDGAGYQYRFTYVNGMLDNITCYDASNTMITVGADEEPMRVSFDYSGNRLNFITQNGVKFVELQYKNNLVSSIKINGFVIFLVHF